ncbi:hypothetical protein [Micromonospora thermarum]|uniref:Secreted protein n=1 Tax=Micromonospora thermarum TaxID=2720024 RepID=A0ABX0Z489_9ACTN|nr:hypothetical protein [Micromonospora thermarum]NJP31784.1 hypothetical protein [Micromonospora thermarum]
MTNDESGSAHGRRGSFVRWIFVAAAVAGILGAVFEGFGVIDAVRSRTPPADEVSAGTSSAPARANGDEQFVQAGQCVRDIGTAGSTVLVIAACGPDTRRVVARVEGAVDGEKQVRAVCEQAAPGFADYHYSNWEKNSDYVDVVFCLGPA